jgi:hypothetical protein
MVSGNNTWFVLIDDGPIYGDHPRQFGKIAPAMETKPMHRLSTYRLALAIELRKMFGEKFEKVELIKTIHKS